MNWFYGLEVGQVTPSKDDNIFDPDFAPSKVKFRSEFFCNKFIEM